MKLFRALTIFVLLTFPFIVLAGQELISVKVAVSEGLSLADSTSSERYRQALESSLYYSIGENEKELNSCGYKFQVYHEYYDSSDPLAPEKVGGKLLSQGVWNAFGQDRFQKW